jgi:hypothetical protein
VVVRALTWKLDPYAVAECTYQTPGGKVGYEGKLCQAILENSGKMVGGVRYEHYGDWSKVQGKWERAKSQKGKEYARATWTDREAEGLGVTVIAQIDGETEPRKMDFDLIQAFPRNSTLWATDPRTQICYTAVRRFASVAAPGLFLGVPFDPEDSISHHIGPDNARDITPPKRPTRDQYGEVTPAPIDVEEPRTPEFTVELPDGSAVSSSDPEEFAEDCAAAMRECRTTLDLDACRDVISTAYDALREVERDDLVLFLEDQTYYPLHDKLSAAEREAAAKRGDEINTEAAKSEGAGTPEEVDETDTSFLDEDAPERNWSVQPVRSEDGKMMIGPTFKSLRDMTALCSDPEDWKAFVEANAELMDKIAQARPENAAEIGMWKKGASA